MSKLYWKLRQSMSYASMKQAKIMIRTRNINRKKPFFGRTSFYPCNRWGVGWHARGRKLNK